MKRAFTLIEMLIVVVVLVTLMSITFKFSSIGSEQTYRNQTIARMQRLENCLSGYYAAYGTYPPVKNHGDGNIYLEVDDYGMQNTDEEEDHEIWNWDKIGETAEYKAWRQVEAACRCQPVAARFPFSSVDDSFVDLMSAECQRRANSGESRYSGYWSDSVKKARFTAGFKNLNVNSLNNTSYSDWREMQVFQFGLMSFLLPRYLMMLEVLSESGEADSDTLGTYVKMNQWLDSNFKVCDPFTGRPLRWIEVARFCCKESDTIEYAKASNIASQRICARWLPNLAGICSAVSGTKFYGITITDEDQEGPLTASSQLPLYSYNGNGSSAGSGQYVLNSVTVKDGWNVEFFYHSKKPYQNYTLWSAGSNGRTFPPWIDRKTMDNTENECISKWIHDDIVHLSN